MKHFTTKKHKWFTGIVVCLFWLAIWQVVSMRVGSNILLPSPILTVQTLFSFIAEGAFWHTVWASLLRIMAGFLLGVLVGCVLGVLAHWQPVIKIVLSPLITVMTAIPVASFIILALVWLHAATLPIFISFMMCTPLVYRGCLQGLEETSKEILEMAQVFRMGWLKKALYIYLPALLPFLLSACKTAIGLAWKSGIAAEIIGLTALSIGEKMYSAKIYLMIPDMFAWTLVVVLLSMGFEHLFSLVVTYATNKLKGGAVHEDNSGKPF